MRYRPDRSIFGERNCRRAYYSQLGSHYALQINWVKLDQSASLLNFLAYTCICLHLHRSGTLLLQQGWTPWAEGIPADEVASSEAAV
jgi:hypothetical protein